MEPYCLPLSGRPDRQILQRVRLSAPSGAEEIFWRASGPHGLSTDTYVNLFHLRHWQRLTSLKEFFVEASAVGPGLFRLFSLNEHNESSLVQAARLDPSSPTLELPVPGETDFFYVDWTPDQAGTPFPQTQYTARRQDPEAEPKLALIITTFQRNQDLRDTVAAYLQASNSCREIRELTHLWVINNYKADAGLLADLASERVTLIHNPRNTGGAGGFDRGARAAVAAGGFSHIVFMDDDIVIQEETWFRTITLLRNLAPAYQEQIVAAAMFLRERPAYCHALLEAMNQKGLRQLLAGDGDLSDRRRVLETLSAADPDTGYPDMENIPAEAPARPYAGWWYCVIPAGNFGRAGFPLPVFFRGDDIEFSLRMGRKVLTLNGLFIWHPDFAGKVSLLRVYLVARNLFIYNALHMRRWRRNLGALFFHKMAGYLAANDYQGAAAYLLALIDFMKYHAGPWSGEETIDRLNGRLAQYPPKAEESPDQPPLYRRKSPTGRLPAIFWVWLTLGGALWPKLFFKKEPVFAEAGQIKGVFPAETVFTPGERGGNFRRWPALKLSLKALGGFCLFFVLSPLIKGQLRRFVKRVCF